VTAKYDILEQIGSGTYGCVYRAQLRGTDKVVALKKIKMNDPRPEAQRDGVSSGLPQIPREAFVLAHTHTHTLSLMLPILYQFY
jgi:hypothetical protein